MDNKEKAKVSKEENAKGDRRMSAFMMLYLLVSLALLTWLLFDMWMGRHVFLDKICRYDPKHLRLDSPAFHLVAFTVIGGGIGGIVNGLRSCLIYHHLFERRYIWKYITAPWMGASLALLVYALIHSTISVFGGTSTPAVGTSQVLSNFAAGALAGYGSKDVFIWLDAQVHELFKVPQPVPDVTGKTEEAAASRLHSANLEVGSITKVPHKDENKIGTVIEQAPNADTQIDRGEAVDITVATEDPAQSTDQSQR